MKKQVAIISIPRIAPGHPQAAPGYLKTMCNKVGKTSKVFDLNIDFYVDFTSEHTVEANEIDEYFVVTRKELNSETAKKYFYWLDSKVDDILDVSPDIIAISIFSWQGQRFAKDLLKIIKNKNFKGDVIVGGQGLLYNQNLSAHRCNIADFAEELLNDGLINYFIKGEAEETFIKFLNGERKFPGLNTLDVVTFDDLNNLPQGDFSDHNFSKYFSNHPLSVLPVESSRGCIRNCSFCEMSSPHGAFRRRSGKVLANSMINYYETYGINHFYFHDDLMNGDLTDFDDFLSTLLEYYKDNNLPDRTFNFSGYWIVRPERQFNADGFDKLYRAGGRTLITGVETGSDRLRRIIKKGFKTRDLEFTLEQLDRYTELQYYMLMIAGIPGETIDDFNETLDNLTKWQKYVASGTIIGINLGTTTTIDPGTHIYEFPEKYNLVGLKGNRPEGINWMCTSTPELDYKERVRRRVQLQEHVVELGYPMWKGDDHLRIIIDYYKQNIEYWSNY